MASVELEVPIADPEVPIVDPVQRHSALKERGKQGGDESYG